MKKRNWLKGVVLLSILAVFTVIRIEKVYGIEAREVPTAGDITLVGEESSTPSNNKESDTSDSDGKTIQKPKGRFPSTGEIAKIGLSMGGLLLLLAVFYLFRKKMMHSSRKGE